MLENLNGVVGPPPDELSLRHPGSQQPVEWSLCGCSVSVGTDYPQVICPLEDKLMFRLLREHLQGDQLWRFFDAWKTQLGQVVESYLRLSERTKTELENITGLQISSAGERENQITSEGAHLIYRFALREALEGKGGLFQVANFIQEDGDEGVVQYDEDGVRWKLGKGPGLYDQLKEALQALSGSAEVERIRNPRVKMDGAARQANEIIALIPAGWHVPGKCRACERMKQ